MSAGPAPGRSASGGADRREDAGADNGTDAEQRDVERPERALQPRL